jgi:SAM-dependent methyltransferase
MEAFLNWHTLDRDASFTAIDISDVAVQETAKAAGANGIAGTYLLMNAEETAFADNSFDLVCGSSILHHLNLNKACAEIRRILRADGCAVFIEPLRHNPLSLAAVPFRKWKIFPAMKSTLERVDSFLFRAVPGSGRYAWMMVMTMSGLEGGVQ